ncbi:MAG: fibronectin type III domain-containing protein [Minisyncoccia bacterium]|jgi:hypothetical protein
MKKILLVLIAAVCLIGFAPKTHATNCPSAVSGTANVSASCTFPGTVDGVDGGITIATGQTLTINSGQTIVFDIGSSFVLNGTGSLVLVGTGKLVKSYLWILDADGDGWPSTTTVVASSTSPGAGYRRLNLMLSRTVVDCNDGAYSLTNTCATIPGAPTIGTATKGNGSASVAFTAPASDGGSPITGYTASSTPGNITGTCASSPCTVSGLTNGTSYTFKVYATNAIGNGPLSAASNAVTPSTVPGAPTIGTASAGNGNASVAFTAPASNGGSPITGYTASSTPGNITGTCASSPCTVSGLTNGTSYTFKVYATNANGNGAASAASNAVTPNFPDNDGDGYRSNVDCNDNNYYVYTSETVVTDADHDGYGAVGSWNGSACLGASGSLNGRTYYDDGSSGYAYLDASQALGWDCNDSDGGKWQNLSGYVDNDGDGYGAGSAQQVCSGYSLPSGYVSNNTDCYDYNSSAHPGGASQWYTTDRGDGSYDYNCDSIQFQQYTGTGSCGPAADSACNNTCPGACQTRVGGWRTDYAPPGCQTGAPSCGQCGGIWNTATMGQVVTECYSCNYWYQSTQGCY